MIAQGGSSGRVKPRHDISQRVNYPRTQVSGGNVPAFMRVSAGGPDWKTMNRLLSMLYASEAFPLQGGWNDAYQRTFGAAGDPNRTMM